MLWAPDTLIHNATPCLPVMSPATFIVVQVALSLDVARSGLTMSSILQGNGPRTYW